MILRSRMQTLSHRTPSTACQYGYLRNDAPPRLAYAPTYRQRSSYNSAHKPSCADFQVACLDSSAWMHSRSSGFPLPTFLADDTILVPAQGLWAMKCLRRYMEFNSSAHNSNEHEDGHGDGHGYGHGYGRGDGQCTGGWTWGWTVWMDIPHSAAYPRSYAHHLSSHHRALSPLGLVLPQLPLVLIPTPRQSKNVGWGEVAEGAVGGRACRIYFIKLLR